MKDVHRSIWNNTSKSFNLCQFKGKGCPKCVSLHVLELVKTFILYTTETCCDLQVCKCPYCVTYNHKRCVLSLSQSNWKYLSCPWYYYIDKEVFRLLTCSSLNEEGRVGLLGRYPCPYILIGSFIPVSCLLCQSSFTIAYMLHCTWQYKLIYALKRCTVVCLIVYSRLDIYRYTHTSHTDCLSLCEGHFFPPHCWIWRRCDSYPSLAGSKKLINISFLQLICEWSTGLEWCSIWSVCWDSKERKSAG